MSLWEYLDIGVTAKRQSKNRNLDTLCIKITVLIWWSPRDGTRTPKIIVLRDYVVLRIAV